MQPAQIRVFDGLRLTTEHLNHLQAALRSGVQDLREILGLGARKLDWLEVKWPGPKGKVERFTEVPLDCYVTITEAKGIQKAANDK